MARLHRNNAAEWIMTIAICPFVWFLRLLRGRDTTEKSPPKPRQAMIEGLPPRTMN